MQHLIYWVMKVRASCGVWIRWQWRYFLRMVQTSEGEELRSRCPISLLPPCYQRTTATENPCPSFSLNNFCATTKEDQILTLLFVGFFLLCYYFHFKPSSDDRGDRDEVPGSKISLKEWRGNTETRKKWVNWEEGECPAALWLHLLTALLHSYVHLPITDIFKTWCIITIILLQ